jgi:hypothetical protein
MIQKTAMPNVTPVQLFSGFTSDGTSITIPLADLSGLTTAEANATTGNGMEVLRTIIATAQAQLATLAPAARPTRSTLLKAAPTIATGQGIEPGTLRESYTATFDLRPTGLEPAAE